MYMYLYNKAYYLLPLSQRDQHEKELLKIITMAKHEKKPLKIMTMAKTLVRKNVKSVCELGYIVLKVKPCRVYALHPIQCTQS